MLYAIIEKYFKDCESQPIHEFLGVDQSYWSQLKKNGKVEKYLKTILDHIGISEELTPAQIAEEIILKYYSK